MSGPLAGMVWNARIPHLPGSYKALLARVADMCDDNAVPVRTRSQRLIAEDLNVSLSTVKRGVKHLRTLGLISVERPSSDAYKRNRYAISLIKLARFVDERAWPEYVKLKMKVRPPTGCDEFHVEPDVGPCRALGGATHEPSNNTHTSNNCLKRRSSRPTTAQQYEQKQALESSSVETLQMTRLLEWVIFGAWPEDVGPSPDEKDWRPSSAEIKLLNIVDLALDGNGRKRLLTPLQEKIFRANEDPALHSSLQRRIAYLTRRLA